MSDSVDWQLAARVGVGLVRPGPKLTPSQRSACVARLREAAQRSVELVALASRLPGEVTGGTTLVVDRPGIVRANATVLNMAMQQVDGPEHLGPMVARITGGGAGVILAFIATNVLGQYEPFTDRLLLSAPSIEAVRAAIDAEPNDFALWVCLHEQTHHQQFAAAPWLRDYLLGLMRRFLETQSGELGGAAKNPVMSEITAVMSLLEGYADMLMDMAGASAIGSLRSIRASIDQRRQPSGRNLKGLVGQVFGLATKVNQYVEGKAFCQAVCNQVGLDGLNQAFSSPQALPTVGELRDPNAWVARLGQG